MCLSEHVVALCENKILDWTVISYFFFFCVQYEIKFYRLHCMLYKLCFHVLLFLQEPIVFF